MKINLKIKKVTKTKRKMRKNQIKWDEQFKKLIKISFKNVKNG